MKTYLELGYFPSLVKISLKLALCHLPIKMNLDAREGKIPAACRNPNPIQFSKSKSVSSVMSLFASNWDILVKNTHIYYKKWHLANEPIFSFATFSMQVLIQQFNKIPYKCNRSSCAILLLYWLLFLFFLRLEGLSKASASAPSDKKTAKDGASASISVTEDISVTVETEDDDEAKKIKVQITEELK